MSSKTLKLEQEVIELDEWYSSGDLRDIADRMDRDEILRIMLEQEYDYESSYVTCYIERMETPEEVKLRKRRERAEAEARERAMARSKKLLIKKAKEAGITAEDLK